MVNHEGKANRRFPRHVQVQSAIDWSTTVVAIENLRKGDLNQSRASASHPRIDNASRFVWIYPRYV